MPFLRSIVFLQLMLMASAVHAADIPVARLLELPAFRQLLPAGTVAASRETTSGAILLRADGVRSGIGAQRVLRVAMALMEPVTISATLPAGSGDRGKAHRSEKPVLQPRPITIVVARQEGRKLVTELVRRHVALGIHTLQMASVRPGALPAMGIHWAESPYDHAGLLEVWSLGEAKPELAWSGRSEGFYFEAVPGASGSSLVLYETESDSVVSLPRLLEWRGQRLLPAPRERNPLAARLLGEYEEVLSEFAASRAKGEPPPMVVDVALSRARMLEQLGRKPEAIAAYRAVAELVPAVVTDARRSDDHESNLARVSEALGRESTLRGEKQK